MQHLKLVSDMPEKPAIPIRAKRRNWAWSNNGLKPAHQHVLHYFEWRAPIDTHQWGATTQTIARETGLNRKTVITALKTLKSLNLISDTGLRKGATSSIPIYELSGFFHGIVVPKMGQLSRPKNGTASGEGVPEREQLSSTDNGTATREAVPNLPPSSTENGTAKLSLKRDTVQCITTQGLLQVNNTNTNLSTEFIQSGGFEFREIDLKIAEWMFKIIQESQPKFRRPNMDIWAYDVCKMCVEDERTPNEIHAAFTWVQSNNFWKPKTLKPENLRKNFDSIESSMQAEANQSDQHKSATEIALENLLNA